MLSKRATSSLTTFKNLLLRLQEGACNETVPDTVGQVLDQTGYLTALKDEQSTESEGRIENLMELVSAAQEAKQHSPDLTLTSFVDRLSLLSETDEGQQQEKAVVGIHARSFDIHQYGPARAAPTIRGWNGHGCRGTSRRLEGDGTVYTSGIKEAYGTLRQT